MPSNITYIKDLKNIPYLDELENDYTDYGNEALMSTSQFNTVQKFIRNHDRSIPREAGMNSSDYQREIIQQKLNQYHQHQQQLQQQPQHQFHQQQHHQNYSYVNDDDEEIYENPHPQQQQHAHHNNPHYQQLHLKSKSYDYDDEIESNTELDFKYVDTLSCVDVARHTKNCPVCSKLYKNNNSILVAIIVFLLLVCIYLLKRIVKI